MGQQRLRPAESLRFGCLGGRRARHRLVGMGDVSFDAQRQGYPLDYHDGSLKYLGQLRLDFYKNAVDRVMGRDPYAAMLLAMHGFALMNAGYGK
jgi:hypothetical protein